MLGTLVLANNSVVPGNFLAQGGLVDAGAVASDPGRGELFVEYDQAGKAALAVASTETNALIATFLVGGPGFSTVPGIAVDSGKGELFVSRADNSMAVVNDTTDTVVADVSLADPEGAAYDSQTGEIFVTDYSTDMVRVINDSNDTVVATVYVGGGNGTGMAFDSGTGELYVAGSHGTVGVVSGTTHTLVTTIPVGQDPWAVAYDRAKGELFVANADSGNVSVINDSTNRVVANVGVGVAPDALSYDPVTGEVFVTDSGSDQVSVINDTSNVLSSTINVGSGPDGVAVSNDEVYVANSGSGNVSVLSGSTGKILATLDEPYSPIGMAYDSGSGQMFVADYSAGRVDVISDATTSVVATIPVGALPRGVAYDPDLGEVFVANWGSSSVSVISDSTDAVVGTVGLPPNSYPIDVAFDAGTGQIFVTNEYGNDTTVISPPTLTVDAAIPVGTYPVGLAYDAARGELFVANSGSDNVSVVSDSADSVVATIAVGNVPYGIGYDPATNEVFVANAASENLSVIADATNRVVASVSAGLVPLWPAYDPATGEMFVTDSQSGNVSVVLDTTHTVVATVPVGGSPNGAAFDAGTAEVFVANWAQGTISILANGYANKIAFAESGLPAETAWTVTLNTTTSTSRQPAVGFLEANGSYAFSVGESRSGPTGYLPSPATGTVQANGSNPIVEITFSAVPLYNGTINESGLPAGTDWSIQVGGSTYRSAQAYIVVQVPNGTYGYVVGSVPGYTVNPKSGTLTVSGKPVFVSVRFLLQNYTLTFAETGLLPATLVKDGWAVEVNGTLRHSPTTTISFPGMSNGTYSVLLLGPSGYSASGSGRLTLSGTTAVSVVFTKGRTMTLTFREKGLPRGQSWCVAVDGDAQCSTTSNLRYANLSTGNYSYAVVSPLTGQNITAKVGTAVAGASGSLDLTKGTTVALTFAYRYAVTFSETGLTSGTWQVTVKGVVHDNHTGGLITLFLPNGTYGYRIGTETGYTGVGTPKPVKVNGAVVQVSVTFTTKKGHVAADFPAAGFGVMAPSVVLLGCLTGRGVDQPFRRQRQ